MKLSPNQAPIKLKKSKNWKNFYCVFCLHSRQNYTPRRIRKCLLPIYGEGILIHDVLRRGFSRFFKQAGSIVGFLQYSIVRTFVQYTFHRTVIRIYGITQHTSFLCVYDLHTQWFTQLHHASQLIYSLPVHVALLAITTQIIKYFSCPHRPSRWNTDGYLQ